MKTIQFIYRSWDDFSPLIFYLLRMVVPWKNPSDYSGNKFYGTVLIEKVTNPSPSQVIPRLLWKSNLATRLYLLSISFNNTVLQRTPWFSESSLPDFPTECHYNLILLDTTLTTSGKANRHWHAFYSKFLFSTQ